MLAIDECPIMHEVFYSHLVPLSVRARIIVVLSAIRQTFFTANAIGR
ncbi:hypothetical protein [Porphyromonas gingivalis]|nr:hypothetical protein [Porphyromonas gingivalis]